MRYKARMQAASDRTVLQATWDAGYSIAELWGHSAPVQRATSDVAGKHPILWGILGIAEYQIDKGAGHRYLRERLLSGDWVAVGYPAPRTPFSRLVIVPPIPEAKFGKRLSAIGAMTAEFVDLRIVHAGYFREGPRDN
jgi:hypothetical protein